MNFSDLNQIRVLSVLSCLTVPLLVTGPFLPDLLVSSLSLWFIYYVFKNKIFYIFKNKFFYLFLCFCLVCVISSLMSDSIFHSFESSLFYFRIGIFCLMISYLIEKDKNILKYFYLTLITTFVLLGAFALIEYFFKLNSHPSRISSFFGDELILGSYLSRLLPLIMALFFIRLNKSLLEKNLFVIFLAFTYFVIVLSGERSALFYVNMSLLFILIFVRINIKIISTILIIISTLIAIFFITISTHDTGRNLYNRYTHNVFQTMNFDYYFNKLKELNQSKTQIHSSVDKSYNTENIESNYKRIVIFSAGHESLYKTAYNMFLDRPIIGQGPKMFRIKCNDPNYAEGVSPCMTHPHNFYIQLLAETGIIGFSFLFFLFIYVIFISVKYFYYLFIKKKKIFSNYQICLLACLLITTWPVIPNGNFFNNYLMMIYCLPIGFFKKEIKIRNI